MDHGVERLPQFGQIKHLNADICGRDIAGDARRLGRLVITLLHIDAQTAGLDILGRDPGSGQAGHDLIHIGAHVAHGLRRCRGLRQNAQRQAGHIGAGHDLAGARYRQPGILRRSRNGRTAQQQACDL